MKHLGNIDLLNRTSIGLFSSRNIRLQSILPSLNWAAKESQQKETVIVSSFQSSLEKEILDILLDGKCGIIIVLARKMYKQLPAEYKQPLDEGRMLILSICDAPRTCKYYAQKRNEYIAQNATSLIFISLHENSSLNKIYEQYSQSKSTITL